MGPIRVGAVIASKYRLEAPLAQGGMGTVWSARHLALDTKVAIKFIGLDASMLDEARKRFEREAKAAAVLNSPHVVHIHDYGVDDDIPYLVMELLQGEDLGARLAKRGKLSVPETVRIVAQVARALRRAAELGIVHRDLKPSNVFIVDTDNEEEELVKVLDFGVAKVPHVAIYDTTRSGAMLGSPRYMSPEQARGRRLVDPRSDLWSLAVIAYRALTGAPPFDGEDVADLIVKICSEPALPPSQLDPELGPEMDAFFERAFARDPDQRFQTARELANELAAAANMPTSLVTSQIMDLRLLELGLAGPRPAAPKTPGTPVSPAAGPWWIPSSSPMTAGRASQPRCSQPVLDTVEPRTCTGDTPTLPSMRSPVLPPAPAPVERVSLAQQFQRAEDTTLTSAPIGRSQRRRLSPLLTLGAGAVVAALGGVAGAWLHGCFWPVAQPPSPAAPDEQPAPSIPSWLDDEVRLYFPIDPNAVPASSASTPPTPGFPDAGAQPAPKLLKKPSHAVFGI